MGSQNTVIVINGKRYDAKTGKLLGVAHIDTSVTAHAQKQNPKPAVIDGFQKRSRPQAAPQPHKAIHATPAKSKTLMRTSVKKPILQPIKPTHQAHISTTPIRSRAVHNDPYRASRASATPRHQNVSKFGTGTVQTSVSHVPVSHPPAHVKQNISPNNPTATKTKHDSIFDSVIANADSHTQPHVKPSRKDTIASKLKVSPRTLSFSGFAVSLVIVGGFVVHQQMPNLAMQVAVSRSGVEGQLPKYKPAGFALAGPISYSPGEISVIFSSRTDGREFQVTQRASDWNSQSLLENHVATTRRPYQTLQDRGKTIYIYDGSNATWVDRGVWYQIEGESALSNDQLLRIANSL